ncbi:hypothetical protein Q8F55_008361 [Vanrija albida]|uniref:Uncharacterized protein n=1 Tax=Vanrija albida TaxID=181172 RepID=A0ABR3PW89_9TREE
MHPPRNLAIAQWLLAAITVLWATTTCRSLCADLAHPPHVSALTGTAISAIDAESALEAAAGWRPLLGADDGGDPRLSAAGALPATPTAEHKHTLDPHLAQALSVTPRRKRSRRDARAEDSVEHRAEHTDAPAKLLSNNGFRADDLAVAPPAPSWA